MFSKFFIHRPIFAAVVSIVIVILGGVTYLGLPVEQTPNITPPTVSVRCYYPGASADVLTDTVAFPLEQEINGVDNMIYMSSKSSANDGQVEIIVTFEVGTDIDMATVLVQNRVSIAMAKLPEEVKRQGVTTQKEATNIVLMVNLISPEGKQDDLFLSNYASMNIKDELARVTGVGRVNIMGAKDYSMRVWMDPGKLKARGLTTGDLVAAIRAQNVQVAAGKIGASPAPDDQQFQLIVNTLGRLSTAKQFEEIIVKTDFKGRLVRVKDVARVELGSKDYFWDVSLNGQDSVAVAVYQLPGANALNVAQGVKKVMDRLSGNFPDGLEYRIAYDTTKFIEVSIAEVFESLYLAILLVVLVVFVFLQDIRTTLVPTVTIPVSLIGTFAVMGALGISINTLSLFGIVLAIGIVVDDAIVVVENVMRLIDDEKMKPKDAAVKAMMEISGPVVATTLVLLAVFVPTAMLSGITGQLYQQFAITIAVATCFSTLNALTLSPALCGILLRPSPEKRMFLFRWFNTAFDAVTAGYAAIVRILVRRVLIVLILFGGVVYVTGVGFMSLPTGFIPNEDQGYFMVNMRLPEGATLNRTKKVTEALEKDIMNTPGVADVMRVDGYSALDALVMSNSGVFFVVLDHWNDRKEVEKTVDALIAGIRRDAVNIKEAVVLPFSPPPIQGLGTAGGFEFQVQDVGGGGIMLLDQIANDIVVEGAKSPKLVRLNSAMRTDLPQLFAEIDRTKAQKQGIPITEINDALQSNLGSLYVNDFNLLGRPYRVTVQADMQYRDEVDDISAIEVRNAAGRMVPLSTLLTVSDTGGPGTIFRFNLYPSTLITGSEAPGFSSGDAIAEMERIAADKMPPQIAYQWSGVTFQQIKAGNETPFIFSMAIIFIFLVLAAQYESWGIPLAVLMSVPFAVLGAVFGTHLAGLQNNIYMQIGLVLLIGLAAKSAILIVEFAKVRRESGESLQSAAAEAARLRFRAILMTAFSSILGFMPLMFASGAGANSRVSLGTAVCYGMGAATIGAVLFVPTLYVMVQGLTDFLGGGGKKKNKETGEEAPESPAE